MWDNINNILYVGSVTILIIALFLFWGSIAEPALKMGAIASNAIEKSNDLVLRIEELRIGGQRIEPKQDNGVPIEPPD